MKTPIELPRTGHEVLMRMFPFMDKFVAEDVEHVRAHYADVHAVSARSPLPGTPHGMWGVFDAWLGWNARRQAAGRGLTPDEAERQFRAYIAAGGGDGERMAQTIQMEYFCSLNFRLNGEKTFYVTEPLTERLAHTEANLRCGFLEMPFPSFQIIYTSKLAIDLYHNHIGVDGGRLGDRQDIDYEAPLSVFVTRLPEDDEGAESLLITTLQAREVPGRDPMMHALSSRQLHLDPEWDIEDAIRTDWKALDEKKGIKQPRGAEAGAPASQADEVFYQQGYAFYRMVMNTILYLTSKNAEREELPPASQQMMEAATTATSSKYRKRFERRARFASDAPFECVGRNVQPIGFGEGAHEAARGTASSGRKIERRFMVRGHWRAQAVGPGWSERRTTFIEPYYKGPDISETINRPYIVRKDGRRIIKDDDVE